MRIAKASEDVKTAAERWKAQYFDQRGHGWGGPLADRTLPEDRYNAAVAAGHDIKKMVRALNEGWVLITCNECNKEVELAAAFETYEEGDLTVCLPCLEKALDTLKQAELAPDA